MTKKIISSLMSKKNRLLRYEKILTEFEALQKKHKGANITKIYREFIFPKYYISRKTLYRIFKTDIKQELRDIETELKKIENEYSSKTQVQQGSNQSAGTNKNN